MAVSPATRRIKCDESLPTCLRCQRSNRECEGYPGRSVGVVDAQEPAYAQSTPSDHSTSNSAIVIRQASPKFALQTGFPRNPEQERLAHLGCRVLRHDPYQDFGTGRSIWDQLLPQLSHAIPTVNAAAAALGAVYEATLLDSAGTALVKTSAAKHYSLALRSLVQDLYSQPYGPVPLLLASVLLACAELLQRRQLNALAHLQGAFHILREREKVLSEGFSRSELSSNIGDADDDIAFAPEDNLSLMFVTLDIQTASYILGPRPPDLPCQTIESLSKNSQPLRSVNDAGLQLVPLIHSCYHFTAKACAFKYAPPAKIPSSLLVEQGRYIAQLSLWLERLDHDLLSNRPGEIRHLSSATHCHALMLRSQCLSTLIYLSMILTAHEMAYDMHASRFDQIVDDVTTALSHNSKSFTDLGQFCPGPGILQPLLLTSLKYRHPVRRRRAIELLRRAGREGPFDGKLLAAVATRAVEIEEENVILTPNSTSSLSPMQEDPLVTEARQIPEAARLHGCGVEAEAADVNGMVAAPLHSVPVSWSRCHNVEIMLSGAISWEDHIHWDIWDEVVPF